MEDHYGLFLGMEKNHQVKRSSADSIFRDRDFPSLTAATQNQTTRAPKTGFRFWKLPPDLVSVPSICESYCEEPVHDDKRKALTVRDVFGRDADKWREVPSGKIPSDITEKYGSLAVRPKIIEKRTPVSFQNKPNIVNIDYKSCTIPEKQQTLFCASEGDRNRFECVSTEMSASSEELEDVQTAIRNSLWTLDEDVQRRRGSYNEKSGDSDDNVLCTHEAYREEEKPAPKPDNSCLLRGFVTPVGSSSLPREDLELKKESRTETGYKEGCRSKPFGPGACQKVLRDVVTDTPGEFRSRALVTDAIWDIPRPQMAKQGSGVPRAEPQFHAKFGPPLFKRAAPFPSSVLKAQVMEPPNSKSRGVNFTWLRGPVRNPDWEKNVGYTFPHEVLIEKNEL